MRMTTTAIEKISNDTDLAILPETGVIKLISTKDEILLAWHNFQDLKQSFLEKSDFANISGKDMVKKSGWRKIQSAFGISDEIVNERKDSEENGFVWRITVKAIAPNGRYSYGVGACASTERRFSHLDHDVYATAHTRAKNRAISDLVGGGEVSAEELIEAEEIKSSPSPLSYEPRQSTYNDSRKSGIPASEKQKKMIWAKAKASGIVGSYFKELCSAITGKSSSTEFTMADIDAIVKAIESEKESNAAADFAVKVGNKNDSNDAQEEDDLKF